MQLPTSRGLIDPWPEGTQVSFQEWVRKIPASYGYFLVHSHSIYHTQLTLSGAHFSGASTPDMIVTIKVFGVADYESEVRYSKFKMADPICRSKFSKKGKLMLNFGYKGFWDRWLRIWSQIFKIKNGGSNMAVKIFKKGNLMLNFGCKGFWDRWLRIWS